MSDKLFNSLVSVLVTVLVSITIFIFDSYGLTAQNKAYFLLIALIIFVLLLITTNYALPKLATLFNPISIDNFIDRDYQKAMVLLNGALKKIGTVSELAVYTTNLGVSINTLKDQDGYKKYRTELNRLIEDGKVFNKSLLAVYDAESANRAIDLAEKFMMSPHFQMKVLLRAKPPSPLYNIFAIENHVAVLTFETSHGPTAKSITFRRKKEIDFIIELFRHLSELDETKFLKDSSGIAVSTKEYIKQKYLSDDNSQKK